MVTILITRPEAAAIKLADQIRNDLGCGVPIVITPMMQIDYVPTLEDADLEGITKLIFTSQHGVHAYAQSCTRRDIPALAVGDATARIAAEIGLNIVTLNGDSQAIIDFAAKTPLTGQFLHIRGRHVSRDLTRDLLKIGWNGDETILYRQNAIPLSTEGAILLKRESPVILPLLSPRSAQLFFDAIPMVAPLFIAAISPAVADKVPSGMNARVQVSKTPDVTGVLDLIPGLIDAAMRVENGQQDT